MFVVGPRQKVAPQWIRGEMFGHVGCFQLFSTSYLGILVTSWAVSTVQFITLLAHKKIHVHVNQSKLEMISISM